MRNLALLFLLTIIACEYYYGKPAPIGDEFEDHWQKVDFEGVVYCIAPSYITENAFFIIDENTVYKFSTNIVKPLFSFMYTYPELSTIASSFVGPQRLLIGTNYSKIYYCDESGVLKEIEVQPLSYIKFLSFCPVDTSIFFATDGYKFLKVSLFEYHIDTLYQSYNCLIKSSVNQNGEIFLTTVDELCVSTDQGLTWDTLYTNSIESIHDFTIDRMGKLYLLVGSRILKSEDRTEWVEFYPEPGEIPSIAGIDDGIILSQVAHDQVSVFKINGSGRANDVSLGIVHHFLGIQDQPALLCVNGNRYLISFRDSEESESAILHFLDTVLPP